MDNPWLYNSWSYQRDCYDLSYRRPMLLMDCEDEDETKDERQFNSHQQSLNRLSKRIRNLLDEVKFGLECLHYITRQLCGHGPSIRQYESPPTISRLDAPDELQVLSYKEAMAEAHLKTIITSLQSLIKLKLSGAPLLYSDATYHPPPRDFRPGDEPKLSDPLQDDVILLRIHTRNSMSPYDDQVGFRCSKWKDVSSGDEPILNDFIEHMDSTANPSPYISIFESAARLLEHIVAKPGNQWAGRIMAISTKRLSLLGISATKSTELQSKFAVPNPDGSAGPGNTDWLVKYWIPKEAIVDEMSVERFVGLAKTYQIVNNDLEIVDGDYKIRIPPDAFPVNQYITSSRAASSSRVCHDSRSRSGNVEAEDV